MEIREYQCLPKEAMAVRFAVFVEEQGFEDEIDAIDNIATHLVMFDVDGTPIATCRIFPSDDPARFVLGRLCVVKTHRGMGLGGQMLIEAQRRVRALGGEMLSLHSQYHARGFYERFGFTAFGEIEDEQGCAHIWMKKIL